MEARYGVPTPCYWCGADATWSRSAGPAPELRRASAVTRRSDGGRYHTGGGHLDHVVPVAAGGAEFDLDNIVPACPTCNLSRGKKTGPPNRVTVMARGGASREW